MELNVNCVRAILLEMEKCPFGEILTFEQLEEKLPRFSEEELRYSCFKLCEAGYINATHFKPWGETIPFFCELRDITSQGHEFLDNIRNDTVFGKLLKVTGDIGSGSLEIAAQVASALFTDFLHGKLGM